MRGETHGIPGPVCGGIKEGGLEMGFNLVMEFRRHFIYFKDIFQHFKSFHGQKYCKGLNPRIIHVY